MLSTNMRSLLLFTGFCLSAGALHAGACSNRMTINHDLLKILDGTSRLDFIEILKLENKIKDLRSKLRDQPLTDVVNNGIEIATDYLNRAGENRSQFFGLIKQWATQRQRLNAPLCRQWCAEIEGDERALLRSLLTSIQNVEDFLSDLDCFLKDLRQSCPKSMEQLKKMLAETRARRAKGEL